MNGQAHWDDQTEWKTFAKDEGVCSVGEAGKRERVAGVLACNGVADNEDSAVTKKTRKTPAAGAGRSASGAPPATARAHDWSCVGAGRVVSGPSSRMLH